jgi:hypothetical protein
VLSRLPPDVAPFAMFVLSGTNKGEGKTEGKPKGKASRTAELQE